MSDTLKPDPYDVTTDGKPDIVKLRRALRELQKVERARKMARGKGKPRTAKEWAIWMGAVEKRLGHGDDVA